ncbi:ABC transporter permease [Granulicella sp. L60]|uniref:ABC transporter permease n=1 Tax=Granulicella sp. L60 TaxID=1641866 RepID=UPI00131BB114|nr:ABC transporter permease [Granulicella sp. L60]
MPTPLRDLKIAVRHLSKSPGFSATAILMLALGIGATTAIFSIVEAVLLRPLPFPDPSRLVVLSDILPGTDFDGSGEDGTTAPDIGNYIRGTHSFSSLGGVQNTSYELSGVGDPATISGARLTGGVFPALAVQPLLGRVFTQQEDDQHQPVAVLSYATWQSRFHADPNILGRKIILDRNPYVVIGVMPRNFEYPLLPGHLNRSELWVPMSLKPEEIASGVGSWNYNMVGRLKPGVTPTQAVADTDTVAKQIMRGYPAYMAGLNLHTIVRRLDEDTIQQARPLIRTLFLAVTVVLLIACANLAGLLLVRSIRRRREIAVRLALGATASALLWQAILESLVLSIAGGVVGLLFAAVAMRIGVRLLPETLPRISEISLNGKVVAFALGLAVITGILCGLAPAFAAIRTSVNDTLKEGGRTGTSGSGHARLRSALVITEIAVALVLLAASGLLLRSFEKMRQVDLGYRPDHTLVASYSLPQKQYANQTAVDAFNLELRRRLQALPGVKSIGLTSFMPGTDNTINSGFVPEGYVQPKDKTFDLATTVLVEGEYFRAMGIPLIQGRLFTEDDKKGAQLVVIVNQELARQSWPGQNPIGKRLRIGGPTMQTPWAIVVGEVANVQEGSPDKPMKQQFYGPVAQRGDMEGTLAAPNEVNGNAVYLALRTSMPPEQMENALRATVHGIDPQLPLYQVQTMEHAISDTEAPRRFNTAIISAFAFIAVLLAVLGIYSIIAFSVALRVQEMAIRMALGSQRSGIVGIVMLSGAKLAIIGCVIGLAGAMAASHLLSSFLFGVSAVDPLVLTLSAVALLLLALAASLLPARRAASVDLTQALRTD